MAQTTRRRRPYAARVPIEQRREQLLDAALAIIDRDGYDRVSVDAIAREAGVTRPVVYGAFDGLGALLLALLDRQQSRALTQLYTALPTDLTGDPRSLVATAAPALHAMLLADPLTWRAVLAAPATVPDAVRTRIDADRDGVRAVVAGLLGTALGGRADAELLAHAVVAMLEHVGRLVLDDPARWPAQRLIDALAPLLPR